MKAEHVKTKASTEAVSSQAEETKHWSQDSQRKTSNAREKQVRIEKMS